MSSPPEVHERMYHPNYHHGCRTHERDYHYYYNYNNQEHDDSCSSLKTFSSDTVVLQELLVDDDFETTTNSTVESAMKSNDVTVSSIHTTPAFEFDVVQQRSDQAAEFQHQYSSEKPSIPRDGGGGGGGASAGNHFSFNHDTPTEFQEEKVSSRNYLAAQDTLPLSTTPVARGHESFHAISNCSSSYCDGDGDGDDDDPFMDVIPPTAFSASSIASCSPINMKIRSFSNDHYNNNKEERQFICFERKRQELQQKEMLVASSKTNESRREIENIFHPTQESIVNNKNKAGVEERDVEVISIDDDDDDDDDGGDDQHAMLVTTPSIIMNPRTDFTKQQEIERKLLQNLFEATTKTEKSRQEVMKLKDQLPDLFEQAKIIRKKSFLNSIKRNKFLNK